MNYENDITYSKSGRLLRPLSYPRDTPNFMMNVKQRLDELSNKEKERLFYILLAIGCLGAFLLTATGFIGGVE